MIIDAFILRQGSMSGSNDYLPVAYLDERVAIMTAEEKETEWTSCKVEPVVVRMLNGNEGAIGNLLVQVDRTRADEKIKENALKKLSPEERRVLGL